RRPSPDVSAPARRRAAHAGAASPPRRPAPPRSGWPRARPGRPPRRSGGAASSSPPRGGRALFLLRRAVGVLPGRASGPLRARRVGVLSRVRPLLGPPPCAPVRGGALLLSAPRAPGAPPLCAP